jgi:LysR family transcriptional regulator (chromosome initiation inhibitor)
MDSEQLRTLAAVLDEGSFEAAARRLQVTPSAVSQRIRALESAVGQVLVQRSLPTLPTPAGEVLLRQARQRELLDAELAAELRALGGSDPSSGEGAAGRSALPLAVNADSLDTWFLGVLDVAATWDDVTLRVHVDDQDHTRELLRSGAVMAGVTADAAPVSGCRSVALGAMRYLPVSTPGLRADHRAGRGLDWGSLPVVRFNAKDDLQDRFVDRLGHRPGPVHEVPSPQAFVAAIRSGLGWGLVPELQLGDSLRTGDLVRLAPAHEDVLLHWQQWSLASQRLTRLSEAVRAVAHRHLRTST